MPIEVEGPDGSVIEFPDGTDQATIARVMRQNSGAAPRAPTSERTESGGLWGTIRNMPIGRFGGGPTYGQAADFVSGADRREPGIGEATSTAMSIPAAARIGGGSFLTLDPAGREDIIRKALPGASERQDAHGNTVFSLPDGREFYANRPGLSPQDAIDFVQETAKLAAAARTGNLAPVGMRMASVFGLSAGQSLAGDAASQFLGSEQDPNLGRAAFSGLANAGLDKVGRVIGAMFPSRGAVSETVRRGRERLAALGRTTDETGAPTATVAPEPAPPAEASERMEAARAMGITLTRGQASRNPAQMAQESMIVRGGGGSSKGSQELQTFGHRQIEDIRDAGHRLARPPVDAAGRATAPGWAPPTSYDDSGRVVSGSLRSIDKGMREQTSAAYRAANEAGGAFGGSAVGGLYRRALQRVREDTFADMASPASQSVHRSTHAVLERLRALGDEALERGSVPVSEIEKLRQYAGSLARANKGRPDEPTLNALVRAVDDFMDDAAVQGTPDAPGLFAQARSVARGHLRLFRRQNQNDDAGRVVETILNRELDATRALDELFGANGISKRAAPQVARRIRSILEQRDPEAWATFRLAYIQRIMQRLGSNQQPFNYGTLVKEWERSLSGANREVTEAMFSREELAEMQRFLGVLRSASFPSGAYNPSGPAADAAVRNGLRRMVAALGLIKGGPVGAGAAYMGAAGLQSAAGRAASQRAIQGAPFVPRGNAAGPAGVALVSRPGERRRE